MKLIIARHIIIRQIKKLGIKVIIVNLKQIEKQINVCESMALDKLVAKMGKHMDDPIYNFITCTGFMIDSNTIVISFCDIRFDEEYKEPVTQYELNMSPGTWATHLNDLRQYHQDKAKQTAEN